MIRDTKTCKAITNPSASPPDKLSLSPAPESTHTRNQALPSPGLQPLSRSNNKCKQDPDYPSRLEKYQCCAGGHLLNSRTTAAIRRKGHKEPQLVSQTPHIPEKLQCQTWPVLQAPRPMSPVSRLSLKLHSSAGYIRVASCVDQCTAPGCQTKPLYIYASDIAVSVKNKNKRSSIMM